MTKKTLISAAFRCLGLGLLAMFSPAVLAAPAYEADAAARAADGVELIAFEAPGCRYCPVFRRDVASSFAVSRAGKAAALRFVDVNDAAAESLRLAGPISTVPTLVVVRDGVEIGRIAGYFGRESTHRLLQTLLPRGGD